MAPWDRNTNNHLFCAVSPPSSSLSYCPAPQQYASEVESPKLGREQWPMMVKRRNLSGPGSSPPRCSSKCGKCIPCKAVHVPAPPGTPVTTEYYPEAWRCKCRDKLFIP